MRKHIKGFIQNQNQIGKLLWLRSIWHRLRDLWQFHPTVRIYKYFEYLYQIKIKKNPPLKLSSRIYNGVFYICFIGNDEEITLLKIPHLNTKKSNELWNKLRTPQAFNNYLNILMSLSTNSIWGKHFPFVLKVRRDGGYWSSYVEGYNLIILRDLIRERKALPKDIKLSELKRAIDELLLSLKNFQLQNDKVIGDWALHNLIYEKKSKRIINVDLEGFYLYNSSQLEANIHYIEATLCYLKNMIEIRESQNPGDKCILKVLSMVGYASRSDVAYRAEDFPSGYHSLTLRGKYFRGQRECAERLENVPYDFIDKVVLDLGCNCGGMVHTLANKIHRGIGIDWDTRCINAANLIKNLNGSENLHFFTLDLDKGDLSLIDKFILGRQVDICFLLSVAMWLKNWKRLVAYTSQITKTLLFESNGTNNQQREQIDFLRTCFNQVDLINTESNDDLGSKKERILYLAQNL